MSLGDDIAQAMTDYLDTLSDPKGDNYDFVDGWNAIGDVLEKRFLNWTLLPAASRNGAFDIIDTTVTDTWETADLSGTTGSDANLLLGFMQIGLLPPASDQMQLLTREFGSSETSFPKIITFRMHAAFGLAAGNIYLGTPVLIYSNGGKFQYRRGSSSYKIDIMTFTLWGWADRKS